jgi:hypothetical protein
MLSGNQVLVAGPGTANCVVMHVDASTGSLASTDTYGETIGGSSVACGPGTPLGTNRVVVPWSQTAVGGNSTCAPQSTWRQFYGLTSLPGFQFQQELSIVCSDTQPPLPPLPFGTPSQVGQLIIVPTSENLDNVQTFDATTGQLGWSAFGGGTIDGPVIGLPNGDIAWTTTNGLLVVHNGTTGAFKWSAQLDTTLVQPPAASQTTIFVATPSGALDALPVGGCNATTCSPVWHATLASPASVRPSIGGNVVYVGSNDGTVTAFAAGGCNASTCSSLWSGSTGSKITGAPAIGQGAVVVGSDDGTVTAFRLQPQA